MADSIIVFDGVCVLCSRWVDFVLRRDLRGRYKFAVESCSKPQPTGSHRRGTYSSVPSVPICATEQVLTAPFGRGSETPD